MVPRREPMKTYAVKAPKALWEAARAKAEDNGEFVSEVIRRALETYVTEEQ